MAKITNKLSKKWGSPDPRKEHPTKELNETIDAGSSEIGGVKTSKRDNKKEYIPKEQKKY